MNKFKGLMTSLSPHWSTPKWLYEELDKEFHFDYDPCPLNSLKDPKDDLWDWGGGKLHKPTLWQKNRGVDYKGKTTKFIRKNVCDVVTLSDRYSMVA